MLFTSAQRTKNQILFVGWENTARTDLSFIGALESDRLP